MFFISLNFAIFLPITLALYLLLPRKYSKIVLLLASYYFYAAWDYRFLSLIVLSTTIDWICGKRIDSLSTTGEKKHWLILSLAANLVLLGFFKYFNFFIDTFSLLTGLQYSRGLSILLPVGISFFTFQSMSYTIDIYRNKCKPVTNWLDFFLFVAFFPQLIAGPIVRATEFLPQLAACPKPIVRDFCEGIMLFSKGMVKKVLFADQLARFVDPIFANIGAADALSLILAVYAFAFQIFFDFSGYSDMASGISRMFGLRLPHNFNYPYVAKTLRDFWRRWHITLSTWLRDYLYIGLGGNRKSPVRTIVNLMITMALGGLWHGAAWNFVLWGLYHGVLLSIEHLVSGRFPNIPRSFFAKALSRLIVFHLVCAGWFLFRMKNFGDLFLAWSAIQNVQWSLSQSANLALAVVALSLCWQAAASMNLAAQHGIRQNFLILGAIITGLLVPLAFIYSTQSQTFIYFQF